MDDLHSWKEIADHLGVTVRCAQRWEQERGMPVRRLPGHRGPVSASRAELQGWKAGGAAPPVNVPTLPARPRLSWRMVAGTAVCLCILAGLVVAGRGCSRDAAPAMVRVDHHLLIACDNLGRELWRYAFAKPITALPAENEAQQSWCGDIDGDGQTEVLYARYYDPARDSAALVCFASTGAVKWEFVPGATVSSRLQSFPPPYSVANFRPFQVHPGGSFSILVVGFHHPDYACQVTLLSAQGQRVREYWHAGYIGGWSKLEIADRNQDGTAELYLGGVNNAYAQATLVVLDPREFGGASVEERSEYQIRGFGPGREMARILFPKGCIAQKLNTLYNDAIAVRVQPDGLLRVEVTERPHQGDCIHYRFGPDLRLRSTLVTDSLHRSHADLYARGLLDHALSAEEEAAFSAVRFLPPATRALAGRR